MSWLRPFDDPVTLPDGRKLMTLRDAGEYVAGLPERDMIYRIGRSQCDA
jgi:hypothetical protein